MACTWVLLAELRTLHVNRWDAKPTSSARVCEQAHSLFSSASSRQCAFPMCAVYCLCLTVHTSAECTHAFGGQDGNGGAGQTRHITLHGAQAVRETQLKCLGAVKN